jgi:signal recognition particle receptor subunit beta
VSLINPLTHEISAKIVYYGPGLSGKTTSLKRVYSGVKPERRGELISLATEGDRTIFFDFLPLQVERVRDMGVRLQLYTVPGQVFYAATRKLVLNGADGVVFVADSQPSARQSNMESFQSMRTIMSSLGIDLETFPFVIQYNKRDLDALMPVDQMTADLNWLGAPAFETSATAGTGILPALKEIIRLVVRALWVQQPRARASKSAGESLVAGTGAGPTDRVRESNGGGNGLVDRLRQVADAASEGRTSNPVATAEKASISKPPVVSAPLSFAALFRDRDETTVIGVEQSVVKGDYPQAARLAAAGVAAILESLPGLPGEGFIGRAALLGLDGRDYLKLCRLAATPEGALGERDALFALHVLIAAHLRVASL